ncbi:chymotrypsin-C-like [Exaiptasia diaphana]|uniref:Peptidase S1 domain-containing protein n=1 Tax=Exaiptasia diaphana TaxID=2652724 RepID=A0A913YFG1_EXADI|nr:chymotrypsin-C-like [Exaiptasia diaphana]
MLCAGDGGKTNKSFCYGDSGGPFNCKEGGVFVLRGIVSWVGDRSCKTGSAYNVLARTSSYVDWINKELSSPPPAFPKCKDNLFFFRHWNSKNLCHHFYYKKALEQFCPITCQKQGCPALDTSL